MDEPTNDTPKDQNPSSSQWHHSFQIPKQFSRRTESAIATGVLSKSVRTEIVQSLSSQIMVYTISPSPEQYNTVCRKLIEQYPSLKDAIGSSGYVSGDLIVSCNVLNT